MIAVTFDVDDVALSADRAGAELSVAVPAIIDLLREMPGIATTWFIRVDAGIEQSRGRADALLIEHAGIIEQLSSNGHEIAWHHHAVARGTASAPCASVESTCRELRRLAPLIRHRGITSVRLGWALSHEDIDDCLEDLGFAVDSTARSRPADAWGIVPEEWQGTTSVPGGESVGEQPRTATSTRSIREVPLTVVPLRLEGDNQPDIRRYVNPAYHHELFLSALCAIPQDELIVTVTHPYETLPRRDSRVAHPLMAFSLDALRANLELLAAFGRNFVTMRKLAA